MPHLTIMLIRHAEKPSADGTVAGVDLQGGQNEADLSIRGWQRAGALAALLSPSPNLQRPELQRPTSLYAAGAGIQTDTGAHHKSLRSQHTLEPLSELIGIPVVANFFTTQEAELAKVISQLEGVVLVAWEHAAIVHIANSIFGNESSTPQHWPDSRFDMVWSFERDRDGWAFKQYAQLLLAGDSGLVF